MGNKRKPPTAQADGGSSSSKKKKFSKGPKGKPQSSKQQDVPLPAASDEDDEQGLDVGEEDVQFVQQYGSQLSFLRDLDAQQLDKAVKDKQKAAAAAAAAAGNGDAAAADAGSDEEGAAEYERKPRAAEQVAKASKYGLPVKTPAGEVVFQPTRKQQLTAAKVQVEGVQVEDTLESEKAEKAAEREAAAAEAAERRATAAAERQAAASAAAAAEAAAKKGLPSEAGLPPALLSLMSLQDSQQRREALKQQMALAAQHLLAEPDKHVGPGLRLLLGCAADRDGTVVRLALLSLLAVFRDLLPGYRIRSLTEEEQEMRVSKEVQALRDFEQALLKGYQAYLKALLAAATAKPPANPAAAVPAHSGSSMLATKRVAVRCMGQLLVARPGFNYCSDLLQALVPMMLGPDAQVQGAACDAVRQLLQEDVQGQSSLEAVQLVADLVKTRKCSVPPLVVSSLLVLRFEAVTPVSAGGEGAGGGKAKKLGKKAARRAKRKTDLDKEFEEAEAGPDLVQLALLQSQMLEALFEVFFRVLKHCSTATSHQAAAAAAAGAAAASTAVGSAAADDDSSSSKGVLQQPWPASKVHRKFPLLQPALEGLGRYSHLISVEYFNDLMAVLQELLAAGALPLRERLGVLLAALDILKGQGEALTIDRRAFYNQLYQALLLVPLQLLHEAGDIPAKLAGKLAGSFAGNSAAANGDVDQDEQWADREDLQALQAVRASLLGLEVAAAEQQQQQQKGAAGSASSSSRDVAPTSVLLLRCLEQQLLGVKQTDMGRLAAYAKRLAQLMLSSSTPEALGCGCLLYRLMRRYPKLSCLFEWEGGAPVGGRQFDADCADPSEAGALAAALWELPLLAQHYHPHIAAAARSLLTLTPGTGSGAAGKAAAAGAGDGVDAAAAARSGSSAGAAVIAGASGPQEVAAVYGPTRLGGFRPAPPMPAAAAGRGKGRVNGAVAGSSKAGMAARQAAAGRSWCEELQHVVAAAAAPQEQQQVLQQGKRKQQQPQQRQQQQQQQAAAVSAAADAVDVHVVEQALQEQYRLSKSYRRNSELRRELALSAKKVEMFREHLIEKQQHDEQQQQLLAQASKQQQQQPAKKKHRKHA